MILLDFFQVMIPAYHIYAGVNSKQADDHSLFRHLCFTQIGKFNTRFRDDFGTLVICIDHPKSWRKVFPYYKRNRQKKRKKSRLDWNIAFRNFDSLINDLDRHFSFPVVRVEGAEGDDVIYAISKHHRARERCLVLSNDRDFLQLGLPQYDPINNKWVSKKETFPDHDALLEKIIRGDAGDGVPNILSEDDALAAPDKRQRTMTKKCFTEIMERVKGGNLSGDLLRNFDRNRMLIDLSCIPYEVEYRIIAEFERQIAEKRERAGSLYKYFVDKRMPSFISSVNNFKPAWGTNAAR